MKNWFSEFTEALKGNDPSPDLLGAGKNSGARVLQHYRWQHEAKIRESVEETFPELLRFLGKEWENIWENFWESAPASPRSLDWFPGVFLQYYLTSNAPLHLKELARFEGILDEYPWTHLSGEAPAGFVPDLSMKLSLSDHEIHRFEAPVSALYENTGESVDVRETLVIWMKSDGVYYRRLLPWEEAVFRKIPLGIEEALEEAPEDPEAVGEFFTWLGSSGLLLPGPDKA